MQTRTYGDLFKLIQSLAGVTAFANNEQDDIANLINRRLKTAYDTSPMWPRYLVTGEERRVSSFRLLLGDGSNPLNGLYTKLGDDSNGNPLYIETGKSVASDQQSSIFDYDNVNKRWRQRGGEWAKEYPDVAGIVETIAIKKAKEQSDALEKRIKEIDELNARTTKERAEVELLKLHPDFADIRDSDDFHEWADEQPKWVQEALYDNDNDARSAARAIDLYKSDRGIGKKDAKKSNKSAASEVKAKTTRSVPDTEANTNKILESEVQRMSADQYEKNADTIMEAIRSGNFVYDVSGSAR
jgi:hypothetical protein